MKETIMLFNFQDKKRLLNLKRTLLPFNVRLKDIKKEDYLKPIGYLAGVKEITFNENICNGQELESEMIIFANISNNKLNQIIDSLRKNKLIIPYKAVLTATNQYWTAIECFKEIKKEHEQLNSHQ